MLRAVYRKHQSMVGLPWRPPTARNSIARCHLCQHARAAFHIETCTAKVSPLCRQDTGGPPWRDSFLVERGKIPFSRVHLARPSLPSKQEKINQVRVFCEVVMFRRPYCGNSATSRALASERRRQ